MVIKTIICFSYLVVYMGLSAVLGDFVLAGEDHNKWQAAALGLTLSSLVVIIVHQFYNLNKN